MPLILHIFSKDARHLWKEIAVTWVLLAWLTRMDCWRAGGTPGSTEGWLNLLLPLAWSYLVALCVLQDPVPGERQFWLTLPHPRSTLFAAKALFIAAFIHLPYLISNAMVLNARGFNSLHFLSGLIGDQMYLLAALTLPALALASVARNAMQFIVLALALAGAAIIIGGNGDLNVFSFRPMFWQSMDDIRFGLALVTLALVSISAAWLQYRARRTLLCRCIGLAGAFTAAALYLWFPPQSLARIESAWLPAHAGPVFVRYASNGQKPPANNYFSGKGVRVSIPIEMTGLADQDGLYFEHVAFAIEAPGGLWFKADTMGGPTRKIPSLVAVMSGAQSIPDYLNLTMDRSIFNRIASVPITLKGHMLAEFHQRGYQTMVSDGTRIDVPSLGKCGVSHTAGNLYAEDMLRLFCESPNKLPQTRVTLTDTSTGRQWKGGLGIAMTDVGYPRNTWLSPMHRREAFFQLTSLDTTQPGSQWRAPREILAHYRFDIEPQPVFGRKTIDYELPGIQLSKFVVK